MLRISKLADYGIVVMATIAQANESVHTTRDIALKTHLSLPTVRKVLKMMKNHGLLVSQRGVAGGYRLAKHPKKISIADILSTMEDKIAMTECAHLSGACSLESVCVTRHPWRMINQAIYKALNKMTIAEMIERQPRIPRLKISGRSYGNTATLR